MQGRRGLSSRQSSGRLPAIAPRDEQPPSAVFPQTPSFIQSANVELPRARLPPRSRNGCWTCRTRKVKCDESLPRCNQCVRLRHSCDYNPRLSFKDETAKYIGRFQGTTRGSPRWDPSRRLRLESSHLDVNEEDTLPPFATLSNDEDRERKAQFKSPGTFFVILNGASFTDLEEYRVGNNENLTSLSRNLPLHHGSRDLRSQGPRTVFLPDPNVIILARFEETPPKPDLTRRIGTGTAVPTSPASSTYFGSQLDTHLGRRGSIQQHLQTANTETEPKEARLWSHYRRFVRRHLLPTNEESSTTPGSNVSLPEDVFEREAAQFPPLFHALMALTALSLTPREGISTMDALQHYEQALIPLQNNLRTSQDLAANGPFLTHYVLLLYEIAASEPMGSSLWSLHLTHLLRIAPTRHDFYGTEPYPFIIWWVCMIDIYAMLSGSGRGEFVETMTRNNLLPAASEHPLALGIFRSGGTYPDETESIRSILEVNRAISILAANLAQLAQETRNLLSPQRPVESPHTPRSETLRAQRRKIIEWRERFRQSWNSRSSSQYVSGYDKTALPEQAHGIFEHSCALYHMCIIYSYTSMWATQQVDTLPDYDNEVARCVLEILALSEGIVHRRQFEYRFIVFPLFMAGFAAVTPNEKRRALEYIRTMDHESVGNNTKATRELLQVLYEKQRDASMGMRRVPNVDWIDVMHERGVQVVNFGL